MIEIFTRKLPPTSNHRLMPMCMKGRGRLIKTKKFREWEAEMATVTKLKEWLEAGKEVRLGVGLGDEDHWNVKDIK